MLNSKPGEVNGNASLQAIIEDGAITTHEHFTYLQNQLGKDAEEQTPGLFCLQHHNKGEYIFVSPDFKPENLVKLELDETTNPYKGLVSFDIEDHDLFWARKRLIQDSQESLLAKVSRQPLTVVTRSDRMSRSHGS